MHCMADSACDCGLRLCLPKASPQTEVYCHPSALVKDQPPRLRAHSFITFITTYNAPLHPWISRDCLCSRLQRFTVNADPPIERLRIPANPANSLPIDLRHLPASLTSAEPRIEDLAIDHYSDHDCNSDVDSAQRCGEEAHAERCLRHRRQSHGRQAEVPPVPRLVSYRRSG